MKSKLTLKLNLNYYKVQGLHESKGRRDRVKISEIVKNIALIYKELGQNDKALAAIEAARSSNPDDVGLIITAANIYFELDNKEAFKVAMSEALKEPNNPILYYNLGVVGGELGEKDVALSYYEKSIELDPTNENSYLNLVALILEGEQDIVDQMNSLGTSRSDNLKYDELKEVRENLYKECVPILQDLISINNNVEAIRTFDEYLWYDRRQFKLYGDEKSF